MVTHFDDKGKIFTDVIQKQSIWVTIQLPSNRIHGLIHIPSDKRIKEEIDNKDTFLALTEVEVFSPDGIDSLFSVKFLAVNKHQVIWLFPDSEKIQD